MEEGSSARLGLLCSGEHGRGYVTVYWGAKPEAVKLTVYRNSQVQILHYLQTRYQARLETSKDAFLGIGDSVFAAVLFAQNRFGLLGGETPSLDGRVVAKASKFRDNVRGDGGRNLAISTLVDGHHHGTAETQVVLEGSARVGYEPVVSPAAQMPDQLGTLGETRSAERMTLGDETTGGVDDHLSAVGDITSTDHLVGLARFAQLECVDGDHFIGREAVVQLAHLNVLHVHACFGNGGTACMARHAEAHQIDGATVVYLVGVAGKSLSGNQDRLFLQVGTRIEELLRDDDRGGTAIGGWAALKLGERFVNHGRVHHLIQGVLLLELRVGVTLGVLVINASDLRKVLVLRAISRSDSV